MSVKLALAALALAVGVARAARVLRQRPGDHDLLPPLVPPGWARPLTDDPLADVIDPMDGVLPPALAEALEFIAYYVATQCRAA
jgi:hypothetical protein